MSLALVQSKDGGGVGDAAMTATFDSTPVTGRLLIAVCNWQNTGSRVLSGVSDTAGNTYQAAGSAQHTTTGEWMTQIWYAYPATGVSSHAVTGTFSGSGGVWCGITIIEVSGIAGSGDPLDDECGAAANALSGPAYDFDAGTLTPSASGGFMVYVNKYGVGTSIDEYPAEGTELVGASYMALRYAILASADPFAVAFSFQESSPPACSAVLFRADTTTWVDIPDYHEEDLDASRYPGGTARTVCALWSTAASVTMKARLVSLLADGSIDAVVGESAEVTAQTPTDATFAVTLAGVKRHKLQLTADTTDTDLWCAPDARVLP